MVQVIKKIKTLIFTYDWEIVEIQGAVFKLGWGIWLLLPFQTFRTIQGYNAVGTENTWGIALLIYGLVHFVAIISGVREWRRMMTFGAFLFWIFTCILIWQQSHTAALLPMFATIAFFMGLNFIRIGTIIHDRRIKDRGAPKGTAERRAQYE